MAKNMWSWAGGLALVALGALVYQAGPGQAGGAKKFGDDVRKIGATIKGGDKGGAETQAKAVAKKAEELGDIMHLFKKKDKGGLDYGGMPTAGIEAKMQQLGRDVPGNVAKEAAALEQAGYDIAAIALVTKNMAPAKDMGGKKVSDFKKWADDMYDSGLEIAKAAKGGGGQNVKTAAAKVNASCNSCHSKFRE